MEGAEDMEVGRVGVPMTDRILNFLEEHSPGLKSAVWKLYFPMREESPIEISVKPGAIAGADKLELKYEERTILVIEGEKPIRRAPPREAYREPYREPYR